MKRLGGFSITAGLAVATLMAFWPDFNLSYPQWSWLRPWIAGFATFSFLLGLCLLLFRASAENLVETWQRKFGAWVHDCRAANEGDAEFIDTLSTREIGPETSDLNTIRDLIANPRCTVFIVIRSRSTSLSVTTQRCGYFIFFSLSSTGVKALENGVFNGRAPLQRHLSAADQCEGVYLGGVAGSDKPGRPRALQYMLASARTRCTAAKKVFARAGTDQGLKLLTARKFVPMDPNRQGINEMYVRAI